MDIRYSIHFSTETSTTKALPIEAVQTQITDLLEIHGIEGATLYRVDGVWKGEWEESYCLTVLATKGDALYVNMVAAELKSIYSQESVLVSMEEIAAVFI